MKKGCGTVVFREHNIDRTLAAMRKAGYEYFETQATNPWCNHVVLGQDDPVKFAEKAKSFGFLGITSLWTPEGALIPGGNACVPTVKRAIEWAAAAGIPVLDFGDGYKPDVMTDEVAFSILQDRILELLETAEKHRVILALEPHGTFSLTTEGLKKILSISSSPYLGINYDAANIHRAAYIETKNGVASWKQLESGSNEVETLTAIADRVVHFHAKDLSPSGDCVALGTGTVDVAGCIAVLKAHGYNGAISLETEGGMPFEESLILATDSSRYLDALL